VYLAGLLESLVCTGMPGFNKPYISSYDLDVHHYLEDHPGNSNSYIVYKDNADFGLVCNGVFLGHEHKGSYFKRVMPQRDDSTKIAVYYKLAANSLVHIRGPQSMLIHTFYSLADDIEEIVQLFRKVSGDYFELIEHMSGGSLFHLEKEITEQAKRNEYNKLLDEFLLEFAAYKQEPTEIRKQWLLQQARKLKALNEQFGYDELVAKLNGTA
jgi:hypothetical protein